MLAPQTLEQIERRALQITADLDAKLGPYGAEIVPDIRAQWHVAATVPACEDKAIKFLSARGFGVYAPAFEITHIARGRKHTRYRPLFPGHLFLFVWDIKRHWRRVKACPGIAKILCIEEEPVVVPYPAIHRMQAIEYSGIDALQPKRSRRRKKKGRLVETGPNIISISPKSYWSELTNLDDNGRNRLLHKALGLDAP
jgi:hypothetical protein